ncbi:hypothetical protein PMAYCL1PPCAC_25770, partial [Pristionchus mayeri]
MHLEHDETVAIIRLIFHSSFLAPSLILMMLTPNKLREFRKKNNLSRSARRKQEGLVKYTIYCGFIQIVQCTIMIIRTIIIEEHLPELYRYTSIIVYIMNLFYPCNPSDLPFEECSNEPRYPSQCIFCSETRVHTIDLPTTST